MRSSGTVDWKGRTHTTERQPKDRSVRIKYRHPMLQGVNTNRDLCRDGITLEYLKVPNGLDRHNSNDTENGMVA